MMERWTEENLRERAGIWLRETSLIVVSERAPYGDEVNAGQVVCVRPTDGVLAALDPVMRACGGVWVAHGSGTADGKVGHPEGKIAVPPKQPSYTLKRLWLTGEWRGDYDGFAKDALWPLCHVAYIRPTFREQDWTQYCHINRRFADAVWNEVSGPTCVWVQDHHFALLPRFLRERGGDLTVGHFWHIPWPTPDVFRICPRKIELLEGLLASDLLGFQTRQDCDNFQDTVARELGAKLDRERSTVIHRSHATRVRSFPVSVDFDGLSRTACSPPVEQEMERLKARYRLAGKRIALGLDSIDYTKGILERFQAVDRFLELLPEHRGRFVLCQAGVASSNRTAACQALKGGVLHRAAEINRRHGTRGWQPIVLVSDDLSHVQIQAYYRLADLCLVTSLHDGMNLVAKEYIASRADGDGVLILSQFTGAARELSDALLLNPFDTEAFAHTIATACRMDPAERRRRMARLRHRLAEDNVYRWAGELLHALLGGSPRQTPTR